MSDSYITPTIVEPTRNSGGVTSLLATNDSSIAAVERHHVTPMSFGIFTPQLPDEIMISVDRETDPGKTNDTMTSANNEMMSTNEIVSLLVNINATNAIESSTDQYPYDYLLETYENSNVFPVVVHRMINDVLNEFGSAIMHWTKCGRYFWINQKHRELSSILSRYFKRTFMSINDFSFDVLCGSASCFSLCHIRLYSLADNRYQSLRRQLNAYGFGKVNNGDLKGYWECRSFCRESTFYALKTIASNPRIVRKTKQAKNKYWQAVKSSNGKNKEV
jgi:hypothetical protein